MILTSCDIQVQYWEYVVTSHCTWTHGIHLWRYISTATLTTCSWTWPSLLGLVTWVVWALGGNFGFFSGSLKMKGISSETVFGCKNPKPQDAATQKPSNFSQEFDHGIIHIWVRDQVVFAEISLHVLPYSTSPCAVGTLGTIKTLVLMDV